MDQQELEYVADYIYMRAGVREPCSPLRLARELGIPVFSVPFQRSAGALLFEDGAPAIYLKANLEPERARHVCGHELSHWALLELGERSDGPHVERWCDYVSAALILPRRAWYRDAYEQLASAFRTTATLAALRTAEVTGEPVAVVTPALVRVRGDAAWPHEENTIRKWSRVEYGDGWRSIQLESPKRVAVCLG